MYHGVTVYNMTHYGGVKQVDSFLLWGESMEDAREWLGTLYEEEAETTPERIDYKDFDRRWYGVEFQAGGNVFRAVIDEAKEEAKR